MKITKPSRIEHTYTQTIVAPPERVFPLLCPVLEAEWAPGWMPKQVISNTGVMEQECLFVTGEETADAIWIAVRHDPESFYLELLKIVPDHTVCRYKIQLAPRPDGNTAAEIAYACTVLGPAGEKFLSEFTARWFEDFMKHWETALNYYLENGKKISTVVSG